MIVKGVEKRKTLCRGARLRALAFLCFMSVLCFGQNMKEMEKEKQKTEQEIREAKAELNANEKKVNSTLATLRKLDDEIASSKKEVETIQGQIQAINNNISELEKSISSGEAQLSELREEYLKAVKKMRVARKKNSGIAFLFSSGSFNEARRRMRYMQEFSEWKDRRTSEISGKVKTLKQQREQLAQVRKDADIALGREKNAQKKLSEQKDQQQIVVTELRANSAAIREKLAKRQEEARKLSSQISQLIAEQRAKEAKEKEERRKKEEELKRKEEEARRLAEQKRREEEKSAEKVLAENKKEPVKEETKPAKEETKKETPSASQDNSTAETRRRRRNPNSTQESTPPAKVTTAATGFEGMKGQLPKPVSGSFKIVSPFGVHPISPELPDIMDENLGIDAHVAKGASAQAVYDGEVIKIYDRTNTPGFRNIIILQHGDYITVYANLETLAVKTGQTVKQGHSLGTVGLDFDDPNYGLIHFEVWKNQTHLDPAAWIK